MLSPSTAPRWKRQTSVGRREGRDRRAPRKAYAARPRNRGSSPRLTSARPPAFTKTRREMVISLPLELGSAQRQPNCQRPGLDGVGHVGQLLPDHLARVLGHPPAQAPLIHRLDQAVIVGGRWRNVIEIGYYARKPAGREQRGERHPIQ